MESIGLSTDFWCGKRVAITADSPEMTIESPLAMAFRGVNLNGDPEDFSKQVSSSAVRDVNTGGGTRNDDGLQDKEGSEDQTKTDPYKETNDELENLLRVTGRTHFSAFGTPR